MTALKRLLRYLKGTVNKGLVYDFSEPHLMPGVYGLYDASFADCVDTRRSTLGYVFFLGKAPISWDSKLHTYVTLSSNHSEYCGGAKAAREAKYLEKISIAVGQPGLVSPIPLFSDSKGAIALAHHPVSRNTSKHIDLADHYLREQVERKSITISYLSTHEMTADTFTKPLGATLFEKHAVKLVGTVD